MLPFCLPKSIKIASWRPLGASWARLGASWAHLGASWRPLGAFWARLGTSWAHLGASWRRLGASWARLEALETVLHASWALKPTGYAKVGGRSAAVCGPAGGEEGGVWTFDKLRQFVLTTPGKHVGRAAADLEASATAADPFLYKNT